MNSANLPVTRDSYPSVYQLPPVFDMNLPEGVRQASIELGRHRQDHAEFAAIGALMQAAWKQGVELLVLRT